MGPPRRCDDQAVQSGTVGRIRPKYADRMRPIDATQAAEKRARIEQMIEEYREATQQRLLQRAMTLWLDAEADQRLLAFEAQAERVH
jgi:hypothetical protein